MSTEKLRNKTIKWLVLGIPAILLGTCVIGGVFAVQNSKNARENELNLLAKAGLPRDFNEVKHTPDPEKDAGELLEQFEAARRAAEKTDASRKLAADRTGDAELRRSYLRENEKLVRLQEQILAKPELATLTDPSKGTALLFPQLAPSKNTTRLALTQAELLAADGKPSEAIHKLTSAVKFASVVNTDSTLITELVSIAMRAMTHRTAMLIFAEHSERADVRMAMDKYIKAGIPNVDMRRGLSSEVALAIASEESMRSGKLSLQELTGTASDNDQVNSNVRTIEKIITLPGVREMLFTRLYRHYRQMYESIPADRQKQRERIAAAQAADTEVDSMNRTTDFMVQMFTPLFKQAFQAEAKTIAEWRSLNAILAAAEVKAKTGRYPAKLPISGPESIDPFTDKPLFYRATANSVKVYSVGPDGKDNNGLLFRPTRGDSKDYDSGYSIPYVVPKPS